VTIGIMLDRGILKPVLPEIEQKSLPRLEALVRSEQEAGISPDPFRRLTALLPRDASIAEEIAVRLRLSNKARKRLACSASDDLDLSPEALAYRVGPDCAADRLLLAGQAAQAATVAAWKPARLPIKGGDLIARGLKEGPIVARTLRRIEDDWVRTGFPAGAALDEIVERALAEARS
jgi:poly(A) polymerase